MRETLYLECTNGISGDMVVGALLDLGADEAALRAQLNSLPVDGFQIQIGRTKKAGLDACDFRVVLDADHENHDHDIDYLYGHRLESDPAGRKGHEAGQAHTHRNLAQVQEILTQSDLTAGAKETALRIFRILAEAEAKAHGESVDTVHFHEVGAVDSIVDIAAAAICLDDLQITQVIVPELSVGTGTVRCQHGILPVPVPAVVHIAADYGIPLHATGIEAELVTPTGAAIVAAIRTGEALPDRYRIKKSGIGSGKRDYGCVSMLRAMLIEEAAAAEERIYKLETDVDDCTGEVLGYTMEQLLSAGALDVHAAPIYMKKNRPAYELTVLCTPDAVPKMETILFRETTTSGIRRVPMARTVLERAAGTIRTPYGEVRVKLIWRDGKKEPYPEYDSIAKICREQGLPYQATWETVRDLAEKAIQKGEL